MLWLKPCCVWPIHAPLRSCHVACLTAVQAGPFIDLLRVHTRRVGLARSVAAHLECSAVEQGLHHVLRVGDSPLPG